MFKMNPTIVNIYQSMILHSDMWIINGKSIQYKNQQRGIIGVDKNTLTVSHGGVIFKQSKREKKLIKKGVDFLLKPQVEKACKTINDVLDSAYVPRPAPNLNATGSGAARNEFWSVDLETTGRPIVSELWDAQSIPIRRFANPTPINLPPATDMAFNDYDF